MAYIPIPKARGFTALMVMESGTQFRLSDPKCLAALVQRAKTFIQREPPRLVEVGASCFNHHLQKWGMSCSRRVKNNMGEFFYVGKMSNLHVRQSLPSSIVNLRVAP